MAIIKLQIKKEQAVFFFVLSASQTLFHDKVYNSSSVSDAVGTHCFWSPPAVCVHRGEALFDYGIFRLTNQLQEREKKNILSCQTQVWLITLWTESSDKATLEKDGRLSNTDAAGWWVRPERVIQKWKSSHYVHTKPFWSFTVKQQSRWGLFLLNVTKENQRKM